MASILPVQLGLPTAERQVSEIKEKILKLLKCRTKSVKSVKVMQNSIFTGGHIGFSQYGVSCQGYCQTDIRFRIPEVKNPSKVF
jgi:hypothetical protein